jgi:hypothetical protein
MAAETAVGKDRTNVAIVFYFVIGAHFPPESERENAQQAQQEFIWCKIHRIGYTVAHGFPFTPVAAIGFSIIAVLR